MLWICLNYFVIMVPIYIQIFHINFLIDCGVYTSPISHLGIKISKQAGILF